jgi:pentatricopeptide repeat protein
MRRCSFRTLEQELPILPFLAPRVFAPWLFERQQRRKLSSSTTLAQSQCDYAGSTPSNGRGQTSSPHRVTLKCDDMQLTLLTPSQQSRVQVKAQTASTRRTSEGASSSKQGADRVYTQLWEQAPSTAKKRVYVPQAGNRKGSRPYFKVYRPQDGHITAPVKHEGVASKPSWMERRRIWLEAKKPTETFRRVKAPSSHPILSRVSEKVLHRIEKSSSAEPVWSATTNSIAPEERPASTPAGITYNAEEGLFELEPVNEAYQRALQGDVERALILLHSHLHDGGDPADVRVKRVASALLRRSEIGAQQYKDNSAVISAISQLGIQLDVGMFNILILNAAEMKDSATAWRIYHLLCGQGVQPDDYTHVILLSMCRRLGDRRAYRDLYHKLQPDTKPLGPHLFTELLACRYRFNARQNTYHLLRFYELHCDLQPLRTLGLMSPQMEQALQIRPRNENLPAQQPPHTAIALIIRAFARQSQRQAHIWQVWHNFLQALGRRDPCIVSLVTTTHTYNAFLKSMCRTDDTVRFWRKILGRMKQPLAYRWQKAPAAQPQLEAETLPSQAQPDLQTYNIILHSCMLFGKTRQATDAWALLLRQGLTPDTVSWNALLHGYARAQGVVRVAETLKAMFTAGVRPDKHTKSAIGRIKDVRELKAVLRAELPHHARLMTPRGRTSTAEKIIYIVKLHVALNTARRPGIVTSGEAGMEDAFRDASNSQQLKSAGPETAVSESHPSTSSIATAIPPEPEPSTVASSEESLFEDPDTDFEILPEIATADAPAPSSQPPTIDTATCRSPELASPSSDGAQTHPKGGIKITKVKHGWKAFRAKRSETSE